MQRITQGLLAILLTLLVGPFLAGLLRLTSFETHLAVAKRGWRRWKQRP